MKTVEQYQEIADKCLSVFESKMHEYGISWFCMRNQTFAQQLYMKAARIRSIQDTGTNSTNESVIDDFKGMFNYCLMWLSKIAYYENDKAIPESDLILNADTETYDMLIGYYRNQVYTSLDLLKSKNGNYSDMWRSFSIETITDLILVKVYRLLQLTKSAEFVKDINAMSIIRDIANYSIFAVINSIKTKVPNLTPNDTPHSIQCNIKLDRTHSKLQNGLRL